MKTIIFDFDGTLVYSPSMWNISIAKAMDEVTGRSFDPVEIRKIARYGYPWEHYENDNHDKTNENFWPFMEKHFQYVCSHFGFNDAECKAIAPEVRKYIMRIENYNIYPDTLETIEKCREKGYRVVLLSNNFPELEGIVNQLFGENYFDDIVCSGVCGFDKPRRDIFELAMGDASPDECYMVGDNPNADIIGGKNMGMKTIFVHKDLPNEADFVCENLIEIVDIIE